MTATWMIQSVPVIRSGRDFGQVATPNHGHARTSGIFDGQTIIINVHRTIMALAEIQTQDTQNTPPEA